MKTVLRVGSRKSPLALEQVKEIQELFPAVEFDIVPIDTAGDRDKTTPLSGANQADFFTDEIDRQLLNGEIDLAIHSSKDLADLLPKGLIVIFETQPLSPYEALVSKGAVKLKDLASGSRIGISSQRRKEQLKLLRPDLKAVDIRGNIQERLKLIEENKIDALIIAHAALVRLGLEDKIAEVFSFNVFRPHPKQGRLSIVAKEDRWQEVKSILLAQAPEIGS